jgi:hypothetical protein
MKTDKERKCVFPSESDLLRREIIKLFKLNSPIYNVITDFCKINNFTLDILRALKNISEDGVEEAIHSYIVIDSSESF